jgi:peptidoglycan/xylan/chitin deacetylase (PgdA/CDA1 family)
VKAAALPAGLVTRRRPGDVVVLLYHRVGDGSAEVELSAAAFEQHLAHLSETRSARTLEQALNGGAGGVVVTFDDGTADFHHTVLPLLVRYRIPALLYLATGSVSDDDGGLSWSQLEEAVSTDLVTVGSHTHSHRDLSHVPLPEAEAEMRRSRELVEDHLGRPCEHFAYPFGVGSPVAETAARRLFTSAALGDWRTNRAGRIDPYRLGRVPVLRSDGQAFFRAKARGLLQGEGTVYRLAGRGPWRAA